MAAENEALPWQDQTNILNKEMCYFKLFALLYFFYQIRVRLMFKNIKEMSYQPQIIVHVFNNWQNPIILNLAT